MDKEKVDYSRISIVQACGLKEIPEELKINLEGVTIESVDAVKIYPYTMLATTRKAVIFSSRKITVATKKTINLCLELI